MQKSLNARAGQVELAGTTEFHNPDFDYTLFEEVVDPENPEGPRAIAMHVPSRSLSKVWQLVKPGYSERIELLDGSCSLVLNRSGTEDWTTMPLRPENPTADDTIIECGDMFCIVTDEEEAIVLSRPSIPFDISFEKGVTQHPSDELSRFILAQVASIEQNGDGNIKEFYFENQIHKVSFVETMQVQEGVSCDVYTFNNDKSRDLAIVTVSKGYKTPLQMVLRGKKTIEGYLNGSGLLTVTSGDGTTQVHSFDSESGEEPQVGIEVGQTMQWTADSETDLTFYEVCDPPYEDGRFYNLPE